MNHKIRIPIKQRGFNGEYPAGFFDRGSDDERVENFGTFSRI